VRPFDKRPAYFMPEGEVAQIELGERLMRIMIATGADVSVEDLGTVPPFVRESIARLGVPGYKVLRWEPLDPILYPPLSVAMTGTHDTEPLAVWWETLPTSQRKRFAFDTPFNAEVRDRILGKMFDAGSNLLLLPIQDIFGWSDRINVPATVSTSNWTFALPWPIDQMPREPEARERADRLAGWAAGADRDNLQNRY
jgi:4-alpha-glucanotransferase